MSAAMIPTGKKRRTSGGGGSGGSMSGRTTMDAASAARMRTDPKLKQRTMMFLWSMMMMLLLFSLRSCSSPTPREGKSVVSDKREWRTGFGYLYTRRGAWCIGLGLFLSLSGASFDGWTQVVWAPRAGCVRLVKLT
ncbi:hypothetical protein ACSQ67_009823 [Phaseolus vulgaris]